jgi:hypothetical protein
MSKEQEKVILQIPMEFMHIMVSEHDMTVDEAIDATVNTVREEIKTEYKTYLKDKS